jgi:asparagine synthase (glutamine-hydrolysing)
LWWLSKNIREYSSLLFSGKISDMLSLESVNIEHVHPLVRSVFTHSEIATLLPNASKDYLFPVTSVIHKLPLLSQYSIAELTGYTNTVLLKDTDNMSMSHSLEVRTPFFDHELIEYVLSLPDAIKYPKYPKSLLVESLDDLLPKEIVHRPKMGFSFPWEDWMQNRLKSFCEKSLNDLKCRHILNETEIINLWNRFLQKDTKVKWSKIWLLVTLEQWLKNINS